MDDNIVDTEFSFELFSDEEIDSRIDSLSTSKLIDNVQTPRDVRFEALNTPVYTEVSAYALLDAKVPHISNLIKIAKPGGLAPRVIDRLILDSRDGAREGFPKDIYTALLFLHSIDA